ncbi:chemotaxis protein CheW [Pelomonas sp. APW6]|uniref:Chemotaxis protein CheW n=1 Tax=Roseateles subflavus TaxID=3053353 RepID=A0ABT7LHF3_9BURK|nr:chemotaxis protein CheW [Pelomonas sp. APW6]MDL5032268.1 chemotaxis protein CheW [Pelomonas sp. APW6]
MSAVLQHESTGGARQMLRLACIQESLLVPIDAVREILEVGRLTPLPQTPGFVRGVMNLRGSVIPVIDLSARFGHGPIEVGRRSAIVVVEVPDEAGRPPLAMGLLVDAVYEVLDVDARAIEPVPALGMAVPPKFVAGMVNVRDRYSNLLNLAQTLSPEELTSLIGEEHPAP